MITIKSQKEFWFRRTANRFAEKLRDGGVWNIQVFPRLYKSFTWVVQWEELE